MINNNMIRVWGTRDISGGHHRIRNTLRRRSATSVHINGDIMSGREKSIDFKNTFMLHANYSTGNIYLYTARMGESSTKNII